MYDLKNYNDDWEDICMNVYDFDGTIYDGDSTLDFYFFCMKKSPCLVRYVPRQIIGYVKYKIGLLTKTQFKEYFYCFLMGIRDVDGYVAQFWKCNQTKIFDWYRSVSSKNDLIISASPEFLLRHICYIMDVKLICSIVDRKTGVYSGVNCYGEEKRRRFLEEYSKGTVIDRFYSDSLSDLPMAKLARISYLVKNGQIEQWNSLYDK